MRVTKRMRAIFQRTSSVSYLFAGSVEHVMRDLFGPSDRAFSGFGEFYELGPIDADAWREGPGRALRRRRLPDRRPCPRSPDRARRRPGPASSLCRASTGSARSATARTAWARTAGSGSRRRQQQVARSPCRAAGRRIQTACSRPRGPSGPSASASVNVLHPAPAALSRAAGRCSARSSFRNRAPPRLLGGGLRPRRRDVGDAVDAPAAALGPLAVGPVGDHQRAVALRRPRRSA